MTEPDGKKLYSKEIHLVSQSENVVLSAINGQRSMAALIQRTVGRQNPFTCLTVLYILLLGYLDMAESS